MVFLRAINVFGVRTLALAFLAVGLWGLFDTIRMSLTTVLVYTDSSPVMAEVQKIELIDANWSIDYRYQVDGDCFVETGSCSNLTQEEQVRALLEREILVSHSNAIPSASLLEVPSFLYLLHSMVAYAFLGVILLTIALGCANVLQYRVTLEELGLREPLH